MMKEFGLKTGMENKGGKVYDPTYKPVQRWIQTGKD